MHTTINSVMTVLDEEFLVIPSVPELWNQEKRSLLYCFFAEKPGYFYNVTENISALEDDTYSPTRMFAEAASVLFASEKEDNNVQVGDVMIALAKILALYIYSGPLRAEDEPAARRILKKVFTERDVEDAAVFMSSIPDGVYNIATSYVLRDVLGLILILLWEKHMDALKEVQTRRQDKVRSTVRKILGSKQ